MDYTRASLSFRAKKALRYVRLYGPRRTYYKVHAQYHMRKNYDTWPKNCYLSSTGGHVGIIGCGNFAFSTIAYYLKKNFGRVIRGCMDINKARARSLCDFYDGRYYTDKASEIFADPEIDLVFIVSNHASHADYAIQALAAGKHVHIEKPHVVSMDQLTRLCKAVQASTGKVNLGFNRPFSAMTEQIARALSGQPGQLMMNWFIVGHALKPDHWYLKPEEGGHVLGNLCHWTDFVYGLVPEESRYPIVISPTRWNQRDYHFEVCLLFGDGSIAALTFSSKGETFEGVRERFSAHRGEAIIYLDDFQRLYINAGIERRTWSPLFRDHGHEATVCASYGMTNRRRLTFSGCPVQYLWGTGRLFLAAKEALDKNENVIVSSPQDEWAESFLVA